MADTWACRVCNTVNDEDSESCMVCGTGKSRCRTGGATDE